MTQQSISSPASLEKPDEILLIQAARRDPAAFGELYQLYVEPVYRYLYSKLGSVPEAEDLTAQTFMAAFENFHHFRQDDRFAPWLFTIARNKAMDYFRRAKPALELDPESPIASGEDVLAQVIQSEQAQALARQIRLLDEDEQELLRLRYLADMTYAEIARVLKRGEQAVKKKIYRLLTTLRSRLEVSHD